MPSPKDPQKALEWRQKMSKTRKGMKSPNKGKKFTDIWRKHLSDSHKGKRLKPETIAKLIGIKQSHETIEKRRKSLPRGDKHHWWKGGVHSNLKRRNWIKNWRNRKKRELNNNGNFHTFGEWELLKAQYNWTCPACHKQEPEIKLTEDHIIPLSKGGGDNIQNIQPLCKSCNCKKMTKIIYY